MTPAATLIDGGEAADVERDPGGGADGRGARRSPTVPARAHARLRHPAARRGRRECLAGRAWRSRRRRCRIASLDQVLASSRRRPTRRPAPWAPPSTAFVPCWPSENASTRRHDREANRTRSPGRTAEVQRQHAEQQFAEELAALAAADDRPRPPSWKLSPWAVRTYLLGGKLADGFEVTPKYIGNARLIEIAVATLATDRALLLLGVPGTAKCWVARAPGRGDLRRLDAARPGHRRHRRERAPLRLELRAAAGRGPVARARWCPAR